MYIIQNNQACADDSLITQQSTNTEFEIVTQDSALYLRQKALGLNQTLVHETLPNWLFDPIPTIEVQENLSGKSMPMQYESELEGKYVLLTNCGQSRIAVLREQKAHFVNPKSFSIGDTKIQQLDLQQKILQAQIEDASIELVTQIGTAGCGKTFLQLQVQAKLVMEGKYSNILVQVPPVQLGGTDRYGFLPGTIEEKTIQQMSGIVDNIHVIFGPAEGARMVREQMGSQTSIIQLQQFSNIRGRSLNNTIVIVDEQQNMSVLEAKAFLTRIGENSKIILLGDIEQIDTGMNGIETNGLIQTQIQFKTEKMQQHVCLKKCYRSDIQRVQAEKL